MCGKSNFKRKRSGHCLLQMCRELRCTDTLLWYGTFCHVGLPVTGMLAHFFVTLRSYTGSLGHWVEYDEVKISHHIPLIFFSRSSRLLTFLIVILNKIPQFQF